jgi:hypothetical protein
MPLKKRKKKEKESVRRTSIVWGFGAIESTTVIEIFDSVWLWTIELYSKKEKAKARPKMPRGTSSHERAFHMTLSKMVVKWHYFEIHNYSGSCLMWSLRDQAKLSNIDRMITISGHFCFVLHMLKWYLLNLITISRW